MSDRQNFHVDSHLYSKSVMLEIVDRQSQGMPMLAYTLTIPPEGIEVEEPQRLSQTKTFGGLFIDDYGPDVLKITISGTTGGSDLRRTWTATGDQLLRNGKSSFFHLRDDLMRYKNNRADYAKYDIYLYDLSAIDPTNDLNRDVSGIPGATAIAPRFNAITALADGYVCALQSFRLSRAKDKPLWYTYRIELIGLRPLGTVQSKTTPPLNVNDPLKTLGNMVKLWNGLRDAYSKVKGVKDKIDNIFVIAERTRTEMTNFFQKLNEIAVYPIKTAKRLLGAVKETAIFITSIAAGELSAAGLSAAVVNETRDLVVAVQIMCSDLVAYGKTVKAKGQSGGDVAVGGGKAARMNASMDGVSDSQSEIATNVLNAVTGETIPVTVYGHIEEVVTDSTTLDALAIKHYNDATLSELIAIYNGITDPDDMVVGAPIRIPVLVQATATNNYVYEATLTDVYGRDIMLSSDGSIALSYGNDFATIEGVANTIQAVNLRLSEPLGARLRLSLYGIKAVIGSPMNAQAPMAYLTSNIKDTIVQDPRIRSVQNITLRASADVVNLGCDLELVRYRDVVPYTAGVV